MTQLSKLVQYAAQNANEHGWFVYWDERNKPLITNAKVLDIGTTLCLIHSEVSEALEAHRNDDFINFKEEIADVMIRCLHLCGDLNIDIHEEILKKMAINKHRSINHGKKNY